MRAGLLNFKFSVAALLSVVAIAGAEHSASAAVPSLGEAGFPKKVMPEDLSNCLVEVRGQCVFGSRHASLEMSVVPGKGLVLKLPTRESGRSLVTPIGEDLRERTKALELTEDEAALISNDLGSFDGTLYAIPKVDELKSNLGFPKDTSFETEDFRELVRVHIQLTLGVSSPTASYLCDRLGVVSKASEKEEPKAEAQLELPKPEVKLEPKPETKPEIKSELEPIKVEQPSTSASADPVLTPIHN